MNYYILALMFLVAAVGLAVLAWEKPRYGVLFFTLIAGVAYWFRQPLFSGLSLLIGILALSGFFDQKQNQPR